MNALAVIFIAAAVPPAGEFSWAWAGFWVGMVLLSGFVALGYRAGWFLPKYRLAYADPGLDKVTAKIFGPAESAARSWRQAQVVPRYQLSGYRSDGFKVVRVAFGREVLIGSQCVYAARRDDGSWEDQVLVARGRRTADEMSFQDLLHEFGRRIAGLVRVFGQNAREVQTSRSYYRERISGLKQRYEALYDEYRQRRAAGESNHMFSTQLTDFEIQLKDLSKRLDGIK